MIPINVFKRGPEMRTFDFAGYAHERATEEVLGHLNPVTEERGGPTATERERANAVAAAGGVQKALADILDAPGIGKSPSYYECEIGTSPMGALILFLRVQIDP